MQEQIEIALHIETARPGDTLPSMAALKMPYKISAVGLSDIGLVRQNNEDVWAELPDIGFFVLADGMGGHQAGEVAAREAVKTLSRSIKKKVSSAQRPSLSDFSSLLYRAIVNVNRHVHKMGCSKSEWRGMGTTLCCLLFHSQGVVFAHVGDSRIYRLRGKRFEQMTKDHSLLSELVEQGQIEEDEASAFLYKNIITKAIGTEPNVDPEVETKKIRSGDLFLICSDGLSDLLTSEEISAVLDKAPSLKKAAETLIMRANDRGGRDNITVVIIKVERPKSHAAEDLSR